MKIKVTIAQDGSLQLITQDGDFDTGKIALEALLTTLQASGIEATQTAPVETHNHTTALTYTGEFSANIQINEALSEDGLSHTH